MPSALLDSIEKTFVLFSILSKPIDYGAADKKDVEPKKSLISALINHFRDDAKLSKKYKKYWQDLN